MSKRGTGNPRKPSSRMTDVANASDEALLAGLGIGDAEAASAFVRRFQPRVYGLAVTILSERDAAQDVAQEAFVRAWRHASAFDPRRGSVATWLLTITRNLAIDALRLKGGAVLSGEPAATSHLVAEGLAPEDSAAVQDEVARVRGALVELSEEQRRALVLARFHGLTAAEIGELEGIPLGTAKTRIRSAMLHVRDRLVSRHEAD